MTGERQNIKDRKGRNRPRFLDNTVCYCIIQKGFTGHRLFYESADYKYYIRLMKKNKRRFKVKIFGFCCLECSIYIVLQLAQEKHLSEFLLEVKEMYDSYFKSKYQLKEKIWHPHYRKITIDNDVDLMICLKSVEFAPVKADITDNPANYPWSSCNYRIVGKHGGILDCEAYSRGNIGGEAIDKLLGADPINS